MSERNLHLKNKIINFFRKSSKFNNNKFITCAALIFLILIVSFVLISKKGNTALGSQGKVDIKEKSLNFDVFNNNFLPIGVEDNNLKNKKEEEQTYFVTTLNKASEMRNESIKKEINKESFSQNNEKTTNQTLISRVRNTIPGSKTKNYPQKSIVFDASGVKKEIVEEGTLIPVVLITHVNMKDTQVPVRFKITEDIYNDDGEIIITEGSNCIGSLSGFNDQGRAFGKIKSIKIVGEKLIKLEADILSSDESYGISGYYFDETGKYLAGNLIATFAGSFAKGFQSSMVSELGGNIAKYSEGNLKNALFSALEKTAFDIATFEADKLKNTKPFLIIPKGTPAILMIGNTLEIK